MLQARLPSGTGFSGKLLPFAPQSDKDVPRVTGVTFLFFLIRTVCFRRAAMKVQVKQVFRQRKKRSGRTEIFGPGLLFASHTHTHSNAVP
jgi:hypothetical protein